MPKLLAPDGATSFSHAGREYFVEDGVLDIPDDLWPHAMPHGYSDPASPPKPKVDPASVVSVPRAMMVDGLRHLGLVAPESAPDEQLLAAFVEATSRQSERVAHMVKAAEERGRASVAAPSSDDDASFAIEEPKDDLTDRKRMELFEIAKGLGCALEPPNSNADLRAKIRKARAEKG